MTQQVVKNRKKGLAMIVVGALGSVAIYVWDDLLFAAPVVGFAAAKGSWLAFAVFVPLYIAWSLPVSLLGVKAYNMYSEGKPPSKLALWLENEAEGGKHKFTRKLLSAGSKIGFVFSCFAIGAVVTTFFIRYSGKKEGMPRVAILASITFSVTYVGFYAGLFKVIFQR